MFAGYAGHPDQVIRVIGNHCAGSCVQSDMRFAMVAFCCLLLFSVSVAQATPPAKPPTSTVAGQVVQDPGGMPLKKVVIMLVPMTGGDASQQQYSSATDAEGHFQVDGVQPGDYRVTLDRNGFVSSNHRSRTYSSTSLSIAAGQDVTGLLFRMLPAGVIQGKIVDEDGDPVPGVQVTAASPTSRNNVASAQTNDLGEYRIAGLAGGEYFVVAVASQRPVLTGSNPAEARVYAPAFYPGTTDEHQATKVAVHAGDEVGANFNLVSSRTFAVRGSVSGLTVPNQSTGSRVGIQIVTLRGDQEDRDFQAPILPNGRFEVTGVLPGVYKAQVTAQSGGAWRLLPTGQTIEVRGADVDGVQLAPEPPSQIGGRFRMETNNAQTPDWTQLNIQIDPDERGNSDGLVVGKVSRDGSFNIEAPSGNYHIVVTSNSNGESWRDFIVKEVVLNGKDVGDSGFSLPGGLSSLEIVASAQGSSIEGNVVDDDGKPIAGILVVCIPDASRRKRRDIYQQVSTDRQGHFALRGLNPGEYQIFTLDDSVDDITDPDFVAAHEAFGQAVTLEPGERKGVVLKLSPESQP